MTSVTRLLAVNETTLAFGLDWVPVLGDIGAPLAQGRREGASHCVVSGDPPAALGLAMGLPNRAVCWSAATLFARQHPQGTLACILALDAQTWHVLACHDGVVLVRADRSYPQIDMAREAVDTLALAYPRLQRLSRESDTATFLQALAALTHHAPALARIRRRWPRRLALLSLLAGITSWAVQGWAPERVVTAPAIAHQQAWDQALARTLSADRLHGRRGTGALLQALHDQPANIAGWSLQQLRCQARAQHWHCQNEYRRQHVRANNQSLARAAPTGWQLDFPSLDKAFARWTTDDQAERIDPRHLPSSQLVSRDWASRLQAILPAFTTLHLEAPRALVVAPPRDERGQALPAPAHLPALATRGLRVEGPLRSGGLLAPLAGPVSWRKAWVSHAPGTRPDLKRSRLILHLEGVVYEQAR